jgi:hypothetical protein
MATKILTLLPLISISCQVGTSIESDSKFGGRTSFSRRKAGCGVQCEQNFVNNYNVYIPTKILMLSLMSVNKLVHRLLLAIAGKIIVRNKCKEL